jgi:hypothetical protein
MMIAEFLKISLKIIFGFSNPTMWELVMDWIFEQIITEGLNDLGI